MGNHGALAGSAGGLPVYFGRCFGFLHRADRVSGRGVVLCSPNGYEALCIHRPWSRFAGALAAAGLPALRFDYPGCGDAPETDEDPERVRAWLDGIRDAVAFLRHQTGVTEVALVGLRLGATLAAVAAQEMAEKGEPVAALALLAPVVSGAAFAKELRVLAMMARARAAPGTAVPPGLEAAGFYYTTSTLGAIKALSPAQSPTPPAKRILIMDHAEGSATVLTDAFRSKGCAVETAAFPGYTALMHDAIETEYPEEDFCHAIAWLRADAAETTGSIPHIALEDATPVPGGRERAVFIGEGLFGILSEPEAERKTAPALLILNTGANHHVGTNRLSVLLARRLVREGVTVLRFDVRGLGDSPSASDRPDQTILDRRMVSDVRQAVDFLAARGHREIVVNGLCAGGWLAYQATLVEPRITGQILLNLQNLWMKEGVARSGASNREYLRLARKKATWLRLLKGDLELRRLVPALTTRFLETIAIRMHRRVSRVRGAETLVERTRRELGTVAARGTRSAFIYVLEDPGLDQMEVHFGHQGRDLAGTPGVSIIFIDEGDHLFSIRSSRDHILDLMAAQFSEGRFVPMTAQTAPAPRETMSLQSQTA